MKSVHWFLGLSLAGALVVASCSNEGTSPTASTSFRSESSTGPSGVLPTGSAGYRAPGTASGLNEDEEFNCTNVSDVRARFSHPGWVQDNVVGLFVEFRGVPDHPTTLRIWWDFEDEPGEYENVPFDDEDVRRDGDAVWIEKVIEHTYVDLTGPATKRVRVELIMEDLTGNCARVREVNVAPPSAVSGGGGGNPGCGGWSFNGACWYTAPSTGMTCTQVCQPHGGFDAAGSQHSGNAVGMHFWPAKANGSNWVSIECSSTDNNTNWGANGTTPDANFSHVACYVNCACVQ